jgi:hypothetical protein
MSIFPRNETQKKSSWLSTSMLYIVHVDVHVLYYNISAKESSRSDWGSNPRSMATLSSTKYQRSNPLS